MSNFHVSEVIAIICVGITLRSAVSLYFYSGAGTPPMFGDYEAQRHWQEITVGLEPAHWYRNESNNDLLYWGLDYPPLTAYHSKLIGLVAHQINPEYVELNKSRGYESSEHKTFMRSTVLIADIFVYIPSILILCYALDETIYNNEKLLFFLITMTYPGQILIDNGHFQYNNISLGLTAIAIAAVLYDRQFLSALFFSLALNYKQMELYHSLPFFSILFATCCSKTRSQYQHLFALGCIVLTTFSVLWFPWLTTIDDISSVFHRLFPFGRGVFEDKVSNFWCAANVFFKLKSYFSNEKMALICLATTGVVVLPINISLFIKRNKKSFLITLFSTSMAFYQFSFQVHEKSILLVVLPAFCLYFWIPIEIAWFLEITTFSMLPLFIKDGLILPYILLTIIFTIVTKLLHHNITPNKGLYYIEVAKLVAISRLIMWTISIGALILPPPSKYPYFWSLIIALFSCTHFMLSLAIAIFIQIFGKVKKN